jgi:hypothetical protein
MLRGCSLPAVEEEQLERSIRQAGCVEARVFGQRWAELFNPDGTTVITNERNGFFEHLRQVLRWQNSSVRQR